jgi:transcription termination factor Rho
MTAIAEETTQTAQQATAAAISGVVDLGDGRGFLRTAGYRRSAADIPITPALVRQYGLRSGDHIEGTAGGRQDKGQENKNQQGKSQQTKAQQTKARPGNPREGRTLLTVESVNGLPAAEARQRPDFDSLTPVYPNQRFRLEDGDPSRTARIIDLVSPIGKGQRGLIVAPPKAGKTTVLKTIAHAIATAYPEVHLMLMLDSLTRLGRAYNLAAPASGRTLTGGVAVSALQPPRQFLGAARCLEEGGSLTILSTALIDTGSQLDNVLFEEFKGTGNMELRLRRDLAEKRMFPAIDPVPSGTRREDLLMDPAEHAAVVSLRRALAALDTQHALELLFDKTVAPNEQFLRQVSAAM